MRILIYPHDLEMGGSQLNAIDLAAQLQAQGHEVIVYGWPGPLVERISELGLEFVASPRPRFRPTPSIVSDLRRLAVERQLDVLHGFEWPPSLECRLAVQGLQGVTSVSTIMSMAVADFIPRDMALTVGTEQIQDERTRKGYTQTSLLEPPIDINENQADTALGCEFRATHGIPGDVLLLVVVSRLVPELKLEGILTAIDHVGQLARQRKIVMAIVGDGSAQELVSARAEKVNSSRPGTIILCGQLSDPRGAYAAADIMLGMGGSALKSMSFAKPLVVQGENGYWKLLDESTRQEFEWQGWYGIGDNSHNGELVLATELSRLLNDAPLRTQLGEFGRRIIEERYSLQAAATILEGTYLEAQERGQGRWLELARAGMHFGVYLAQRAAQRVQRKVVTDDFNSQRLVAGRESRLDDTQRRVIFVPGTFWDDVQGTDHMLASALAQEAFVLWVDPPRSIRSSFSEGQQVPLKPVGVDQVGVGVTRIRTQVPAGVRFAAVRNLYDLLPLRRIRAFARTREAEKTVIVNASATAAFPRLVDGLKILYVTDDWIAGEKLMGLPNGSVSKRLKANLAQADVVFAVSPTLVQQLTELDPTCRVALLPNGCRLQDLVPDRGQPSAGLVGQLNERLDLSLLEAIADAGIALRIAGPLRGGDPLWRARMERFLASPGVEWVGQIPTEQVPEFLSHSRVGITPYAVNEFNQASFPLKTLDYLAAGLPVISTNLPSSAWLNTGHVLIADSIPEFVELLGQAVASALEPAERAERLQIAEQHSWPRRAQQLLAEIDDCVLSDT
ncbi:glycosyltransferase [Glutamicibacter sp. NPDC087344]|uniref:glycosyltransferase n=1 Tax=Glutamicibacter sp. NPDC087344 TaxID=3363994 RepID=UPI00382E456C